MISEQVSFDWTGHAAGNAQNMSQENLWIDAARKDLSAFEPLYRKYYEQIYAFIFRRIEDKDDVQDVTSLVFEKAMLNLNKYQARGLSFGSWLYRIALSETGNYYRKNARERKVSLSTDSLQQLSEELDEPVFDEQVRRQLIAVVQHLSPEEMELLVLRYVEKIPYTELAALKETSENALRVKLHRIIDRLKKAFNRPG